MKVYRYMVTIECDTEEQADQVIVKRIAHDEDYGFEYTIDYGAA